MLQYMKKGFYSITLLTLVTLLLSSSVSFGQATLFFAANIQGTWQVDLNKVVLTNVNRVGPAPSETFSDTATMKITQFSAAPGGGNIVRIEIDGTTNPLIDGITPTPDFKGQGVLLSMVMIFTTGFTNFHIDDNHMVAIHCDSDGAFVQQIIVHRISDVDPNLGFTRMEGTWVIVDNRPQSAGGIIAEFKATKLNSDNPNVSACP